MDVFDFITPEEIDDLPDDDPRTAFVTFVRIAQKRLSARVKELNGDSDGWRDISEAQQRFMNIVVAAAKRFEIEPFASLEVPRIKDFDYEDNRQFRADLDHYIDSANTQNQVQGHVEIQFLSLLNLKIQFELTFITFAT